MTSPPRARSEAISDRYDPPVTGCEFDPFQVAVHEPFDAAWRNASVKYVAPDDCAVLVRLGVLLRYVS
jgi:hypothetical protein